MSTWSTQCGHLAIVAERSDTARTRCGTAVRHLPPLGAIRAQAAVGVRSRRMTSDRADRAATGPYADAPRGVGLPGRRRAGQRRGPAAGARRRARRQRDRRRHRRHRRRRLERARGGPGLGGGRGAGPRATESRVRRGPCALPECGHDPERLDVEQALPRMQALASRLWSPGGAAPPRPAGVVGGLRRARGARPRPGLPASTTPGRGWSRADWLEVCGTDPAAVDAVVTRGAGRVGRRGHRQHAGDRDRRRRACSRDHGFTEVESAVVHPPPPRPRRPAGRRPARGVRRPRGARRASTSSGRRSTAPPGRRPRR